MEEPAPLRRVAGVLERRDRRGAIDAEAVDAGGAQTAPPPRIGRDAAVADLARVRKERLAALPVLEVAAPVDLARAPHGGDRDRKREDVGDHDRDAVLR